MQWQANTSGCFSERVLHQGKAIFTKSLPGGSSATAQPSFCQCGHFGLFIHILL